MTPPTDQNESRPHPWLTPLQELLLRAAVLPGELGKSAWAEWCLRADLKRLDFESYRTLPLVYPKIGNDARFPRLKNIYLRTHLANRELFRGMAEVLRLLGDAGIPTLILKGAALCHSYYPKLGMRYMDDFDLLIPPDRVPHAFRLLNGAGWKRISSPTFECSFLNQKEKRLDLHWYLNGDCVQEEANRAIWEVALPIEFEGVASRILCPAHQLFHVIIHSVGALGGCIRWVADAMAVLQGTPSPLDWEAFLKIAEDRQLMLPTKTALHYLKKSFAAPIPVSILEKMDRSRISRLDRWSYDMKVYAYGREKRRDQLALFFLQYLRWVGSRSGMTPASSLPHYLYFRWQRPPKVAFLRRFCRRVFGYLTSPFTSHPRSLE